MITSLTQYIEGVLESESAEQRDWRKDIPTKLYRVNHALTGLVTEIAELLAAIDRVDVDLDRVDVDVDWVNVTEELGDAWWYAAVLCDVTGHHMMIADDPCDGTPDERISAVKRRTMQLTRYVGDSFDVIKRRIYYFAEELEDGHEKKAKAAWKKIQVQDICVTLANLVNEAGMSLHDVWTINLLKLIGPNGRYAGKFDADKALHRNLLAERETLERRATDVD